MKKFIIMSLAVFALALVACQSDKQKCEKEGKIWIAEGEKCISQDQQDCEEKEGMAWNEEENKCEEKSDAQAECEAQYKKWENNQCVDKLFIVLLKSKKENSNDLLEVNDVGTKSVSLINPGECVKVTTSNFDNLKVSIADSVLCDNTKNPETCAPGHIEVEYIPARASTPADPIGGPGVSISAKGYTLTKKDEAPECTVKDTIE
ncbi:MAG: hypothetical protein OXM55_07720 [Bdellovibrionales bacterium]|nr:hypothetical protein [Bdellovibrionales bacterium]